MGLQKYQHSDLLAQLRASCHLVVDYTVVAAVPKLKCVAGPYDSGRRVLPGLESGVVLCMMVAYRRSFVELINF